MRIAKAFVFTAGCAVACSAALTPMPAFAQSDVARMSGAGTDIRRFDIAPGIYQFMTMRDSYVRQLNSIVIVNDEDVLVFDTNTRPSSARLILAEIRKITDKPVRFVVNSHNHPDHWSGNEVYAQAFPGLQIIATKQTDELMHQMAGVWAPRFAAELAARRAAAEVETRTGRHEDGTAVTAEQKRQQEADLEDYASFVGETEALHRVFPTSTFEKDMTFVHGGREFRLISVAGDQEGTAVLYLPKEKVLITGDAVSYPIPYICSRPSLQIESLKMLSQLDARTIIPGHGPAFADKQFLLMELALLEEVNKGVTEARQRGVTNLEALQAAVTADGLRERFAHGDPDLEARFRSRVSALVAFALAEQIAPPEQAKTPS